MSRNALKADVTKTDTTKTKAPQASAQKTRAAKAGASKSSPRNAGTSDQRAAPSPPRTSGRKASPRDTGPALDEFICFALYSANHAMNRVYKPLLDELGLTYPQYIALSALWEEDGQTVGEICETLFLESSTVTPLLKRLEKMALVTRRRDREDERQVRISLTPEGRRLKARARKIPGCILAASGLGEKALMKLQGQIADLRENLTRAAAE